MDNAFYEYGIAKATKQVGFVDAITRKAPILAMMPVQESSDAYWNNAEILTDVTGAGLIDFDAPYPTTKTDTGIVQVPLSIFAGKMTVGKHQAELMGGAEAYFASKLLSQLKSSGSQVDKSIYYNSLRAFAILNSNYASAGGAGSTNYSITATTWTDGEVTGLVNKSAFDAGLVFDLDLIGGGDPFFDSEGKLIHAMTYESKFGVQLLNDRYVSSIVNIDLANNPSGLTAKLMDELLLNCEADEGTIINTHPAVITALQGLKGDYLQMGPKDDDVNRIVAFWNGIKLVGDYNLLNGTEAKVS